MLCNCCGDSAWKPLFEENGYTLRRCRNCGLHAIDPMPSVGTRMTEMEEGHFAGGRRVLDARRQSAAECAQRPQFEKYVERVSHHRADGRWLDIGCGAGSLMQLAHEYGFKPEGIELTPVRRGVAEELTGLTVHGRPVEELDFPDGIFDVISLIDVFSHLTDPSATLRELARILAPDGVVLMVTGELDPGIAKSHVFSWSLGDHLYFLGDGTLPQLAQRSGLRVVEQEKRWHPDITYTRERFRLKGTSHLRNALKAVILTTPGVLTVLRRAVLTRQAGNKAYSTISLLVTEPFGTTS